MYFQCRVVFPYTGNVTCLSTGVSATRWALPGSARPPLLPRCRCRRPRPRRSLPSARPHLQVGWPGRRGWVPPASVAAAAGFPKGPPQPTFPSFIPRPHSSCYDQTFKMWPVQWVSRCALTFLDCSWGWAPFLIFTDYLNILLWVSLSCGSSLCVLDRTPSSVTCVTNIFSQAGSRPFNLFKVDCWLTDLFQCNQIHRLFPLWLVFLASCL